MTKVKTIWGHEESLSKKTILPITKRIVADQSLSIQVHPKKTECWYIESVEENAFLYIGLKSGINYLALIRDITAGNNIEHYLNKVYARQGQFFIVPNGTIHAIGKGISIIETQNMKDCTYRIYDFERDRGLDTNRALYCISYCYHNPYHNNYF